MNKVKSAILAVALMFFLALPFAPGINGENVSGQTAEATFVVH